MIYVSHDLIRNPNISSEEFLAYVFVQIHTYSNNYDSCLFRVGDIVDQSFGETKSHSIYNNMSKNIKSLIDKGLVDAVCQKSSIRIFMSSYNMDKEGFVKADANDLRDIVDNVPKNKADVLRFYFLVLSSITNNKTGCRERIWFADIMGVSRDTISRYSETLEKMKKIYVYRAANFYISNTYGLYKDKDAVITVGEKRSHGRAAHENANEKRKYVAMYYSLLNGTNYPINTMKEMLNYLSKRNEEVEKLGKRARGMVYDLQPLIDKINGE